jgi:hypothetical protein
MKQARMAKVLGCLVGAMTLGAAGLMWVEPHTTHLYPDAAGNGVGSYMLRAQSLADRPHWRGVLIEHCVPEGASASGGTSGEPGYHFIVDTDGLREVSELWGAQQDVSGRQGQICIGVQGHPRSADVSIQQWESLLSLLRSIQGRYRIDGPHIQLRCHPSITTPALRQQAAQLAAMLRAAGIR